ncbi:endospore germination permease [Tumebacillus sp. ITR2]|uniref:Endospore germination permease n=1 Tax=Tumebacillus amylolyticus TaxID=2801339 RepID=A0ABS1J8J8_9BACL|nr:endospore germination permease [Tumebacillus amylolyticus]MBL0386607.1 endospore germination permease [Tumebacillus amylolyticus]
MERISSIQFVALLILFQIGSYVIFGFAASAKQDAWIVALLSTGSGLFLTLLYHSLYAKFPGREYVEILQATLGVWLGRLMASLYLLAFLYVAGRVLRDFGELVTSFILPRTPMLVVLVCMLLLVYYGLRSGLEVVGRMAELMFFLFCLFLLVQSVLMMGSKMSNFEFLLPIAHDKKKLLENWIPLGLTVPFGETIAFVMFYKQVKRQELLRFLLFFSVLGAGLVLTLLNLVAVSVLGPELFARNIYPMITAVQQVSLADFIENLDSMIVVYIGIAAFFKVSVFLYAAAVGTASLFRLQEYRSVAAPLSLVVLLLSFFMSDNLPEHVFVGLRWVPWLLWVPLFILVPLLVWLLAKFRRREEGEHVQTKNAENADVV